MRIAGVTLALAMMLANPVLEEPIEPVETIEEPNEMKEYFETDEGELFLKCVYAEAGNQKYEGMRKVACVILNRKEGSDFPDTIEGVITQKLKVYMFSSYPNGIKKWEKEALKSDTCKQAIWDEINERTDTEIVYFRTGRYSDYGTPAYIVGEHYFSRR